MNTCRQAFGQCAHRVCLLLQCAPRTCSDASRTPWVHAFVPCAYVCVPFSPGMSDSYMKRLSARSVEEKEQLERMHANGKVLVGVTLGERIGKGGFGRVFEGMYCSTPCALKVRSLLDTPQFQYKQLVHVCGAGGWGQWRRRGNLGRNKSDVQSIPPICGARVRHLGRARQGFRSNLHGARGRVFVCLRIVTPWCWLACRP